MCLKRGHDVIYIRADSSRCGWIGTVVDTPVYNQYTKKHCILIRYANGVLQKYHVHQAYLSEHFVYLDKATRPQIYMAMQRENPGFTDRLFALRDNLAQEARTLPCTTQLVQDPLDTVGEFYCFVEGSTQAPKVAHKTQRIAQIEATRLAKTYGKPVRILAAVSTISVRKVTTYEVEVN